MRKIQYHKTFTKLALLVGLMYTSQVQSADFGVVVVDEFGEAVSDASVCLGLAGNIDQFGVYKTSADGKIMARNLPNLPMLVTVSKNKYQGIEFTQPRHSYNLVRDVTLLLDGEGPTCNDFSMVDTSKYMLGVEKLQAVQNQGMLLIESEILGQKPTHYRVSHSKDFRGAKWKNYQSEVAYYGRASGQLYFQVRHFTGKHGSWVDARSKVETVYIN